MRKPRVKIYTDGACAKNPGRGGYGAILLFKKTDGEVVEKEISKGFIKTTNNRMELLAVIDALKTLKVPCKVKLYSDSKYVVDAINKRWIENWVERNWKIETSSPVKNVDLWKKLLSVLRVHEVEFIWVKGHSSNVYNGRCDELAVEARRQNDLVEDEGFNL